MFAWVSPSAAAPVARVLGWRRRFRRFSYDRRAASLLPRQPLCCLPRWRACHLSDERLVPTQGDAMARRATPISKREVGRLLVRARGGDSKAAKELKSHDHDAAWRAEIAAFARALASTGKGQPPVRRSTTPSAGSVSKASAIARPAVNVPRTNASLATGRRGCSVGGRPSILGDSVCHMHSD